MSFILLLKTCLSSTALCRRRSWTTCSTMLNKLNQHGQHVQNTATHLVTTSQGPGSMSVVWLGWFIMTCTGWLFIRECSTSLLWRSIAVFGTELQCTSPTTVCPSPKLLVASICNLPCHQLSVNEFAAAPFEPVHFLSPDQQSGIHCPITCRIQLLTPNNLGGTWTRICSPAFEALAHYSCLRNNAP